MTLCWLEVLCSLGGLIKSLCTITGTLLPFLRNLTRPNMCTMSASKPHLCLEYVEYVGSKFVLVILAAHPCTSWCLGQLLQLLAISCPHHRRTGNNRMSKHWCNQGTIMFVVSIARFAACSACLPLHHPESDSKLVLFPLPFTEEKAPLTRGDLAATQEGCFWSRSWPWQIEVTSLKAQGHVAVLTKRVTSSPLEVYNFAGKTRKNPSLLQVSKRQQLTKKLWKIISKLLIKEKHDRCTWDNSTMGGLENLPRMHELNKIKSHGLELQRRNQNRRSHLSCVYQVIPGDVLKIS